MGQFSLARLGLEKSFTGHTGRRKRLASKVVAEPSCTEMYLVMCIKSERAAIVGVKTEACSIVFPFCECSEVPGNIEFKPSLGVEPDIG
jgi:hypothetical protein